jgi:hypothetical protein
MGAAWGEMFMGATAHDEITAAGLNATEPADAC